MAIIYTYPRLTNPDGTELIVVSETKNQNATRLLSVGDICEFCSDPSGEGCSNSFLTVTTPSIIPATALGCDDNLVLTSGDGSVTISNVGNTINFTTVGGGGGGGCPTTYVIKPVYCEGENCYTDHVNYNQWIYTCDETIGALAPGYIEELIINGDTILPPSETTCWYIEELAISATSTVCCCDELTQYKLKPCSWGTTYYTTELQTPGISAQVGNVVFATGPEGLNCYTVSEESGPSTTALVLGVVTTCESEECPDPPAERLLLEPCYGNSSGYLVDIITDTTQSPTLAGVLSGETISIDTIIPEDSACYEVSLTADPIGATVVVLEHNYSSLIDACDCCAWEFRTYEECFTGTQWTFSINTPTHEFLANNPECIKIVPLGMEMPPVCLNFVECTEYVEHPDPVLSMVDNSPDCCEDVDCPSTVRYEICPDGPVGYEEFIYLPIPLTTTTSVILATGELDPAGFPGVDLTWCYTAKDNVEGPVFAGTVADYCLSPGHCMCPEVCEIMEYFDCDDPGTLLYTTNIYLPPAGFIWGIAEDDNCYKTVGPVEPNGLPLNAITVDAVWMDDAEDCGCCDSDLYPFIYEYTLCPGEDPAAAPPFVTVDITGFPGYLAGAYPDVISVDVGIGYDVCYEFSEGVCVAAAEIIVDYYENCETCIASEDPTWELESCDGEDTEYIKRGDLDPNPAGLNVDDVINITAGTLSAIADCWVIKDKDSGEATTQIGTQDWNGPIIGNFYSACDCCEKDLRLYNVCDLGAPCQPTVAPQLVIDMISFGGTPPTWIRATDIAQGLDCCYELYGFAECVEETGIYVNVITGCEDEICASLAPVWDLLPCGGTPGVDNVYLSELDFNPDPSGLNVGDIIDLSGGTISDGCYEVMDKNSAHVATHVVTHDWEGPIAGGGTPTTTPCDCCEMDLRLYDVCVIPCAAVAPQLIIDMAAVPGPTPTNIVATDVATGNDCCYYLNVEIPECQEYTGTYVSTVIDCEDEPCEALAPIWELESCAGATKYVSENDFVADPSGLNVGDVINITVGTLSGDCWEIIDKDSGGGPLEVGTQTWNGPISISLVDSCDLRTYNICDEGDPCQTGAAPSLVIDVDGVVTSIAFIRATENATGNDCCYQLDPVLPGCVEITGTFVSSIDNCEEAVCGTLPGP